MTYIFEPYNRQLLDQAVQQGGSFTFSLGTNDVGDLGLSHPDDVAQVRDGGRFDLTPWRKNPIRRVILETPLSAREILHDASRLAGHLYLQYEQAGGSAGMGDISATYNPMDSTTLRVVQLDPNEA